MLYYKEDGKDTGGTFLNSPTLKVSLVRRLKFQSEYTESYPIPEVLSAPHSTTQENKLENSLREGSKEEESRVGWGHQGRCHGESHVPDLWDG